MYKLLILLIGLNISSSATAAPFCEDLFRPGDFREQFDSVFFDRLSVQSQSASEVAALIVKENNSGPFENSLQTTSPGKLVAYVGRNVVAVAHEVLDTAAFMTVRSRANGQIGISDRDAAKWFRESLEAAAADSNLLTTHILIETLAHTKKRGGLPGLTDQAFERLKRETVRATPFLKRQKVSYDGDFNLVEHFSIHFYAGTLSQMMADTNVSVLRFEFRFHNVDFPIYVDLVRASAQGVPLFELRTENQTVALPASLSPEGFRRALEVAASREKFQSER